VAGLLVARFIQIEGVGALREALTVRDRCPNMNPFKLVVKQATSKPGRVLINAQIVGPLRESGKHAFIQCLTAFDPKRA